MISSVNGYKIDKDDFLGRGTFGSVYKAEKNGQYRAVKIIQTQFLRTDYTRKRIEHEVKALEKIAHPNVVKIYDHGTFDDKGFDYYYIVMDYIDGDELSKLVGKLEEDQLIDLVKKIVLALDHIHTKNIYHRDLKPSNIMVRSDGEPIILDFGVAKLIDFTSITPTGAPIGTYRYMSPEQIDDSKNINSISDYYSLGVIIYELITGVPPFDAQNVPALINQIKNNYPTPASNINPEITNELENVVCKLLEKEPYKRYQDAKSLLADLERHKIPKGITIDKKPKFFARLLHTEKTVIKEAFDKGFVDNIIFPSNFFQTYHPTVKLLTKSGKSFITDPSTNRLTHPTFSNIVGLKELPYAPSDQITPIQKKDFDSISDTQNFVDKVLEYQVQNKTTELVAPFFYVDNIESKWFEINLKLLRESLAWRDKNKSQKPLWGAICTKVDRWYEKEISDKVLNSYCRWAPDGFLIYADTITTTSSLSELYYYSKLLLELQKHSKKPVIACRVNGLGLLLMCLGLTGMSSGIGALDSFYKGLLLSIKKDYNVPARYYIPELMCMVSLPKNIATKLIDLFNSSIGKEVKCKCKYCTSIESNGSISQMNVKLHFLRRRHEDVTEIKSLPNSKKASYIKSRIKKAIEYHTKLRSEGVRIISTSSYLNNWLELVKKLTLT